MKLCWEVECFWDSSNSGLWESKVYCYTSYDHMRSTGGWVDYLNRTMIPSRVFVRLRVYWLEDCDVGTVLGLPRAVER